MSHKKFSKKTFVLSGAVLAIILCAAFYFGVHSGKGNNGNGIITYAETPFERERHLKEIELKKILCESDKENIVETWVYLGSADDKITGANIFIVCNEEITNKDELMTLASESLNIDSENICIDSMDVKTFTSNEKER